MRKEKFGEFLKSLLSRLRKTLEPYHFWISICSGIATIGALFLSIWNMPSEGHLELLKRSGSDKLLVFSVENTGKSTATLKSIELMFSAPITVTRFIGSRATQNTSKLETFQVRTVLHASYPTTQEFPYPDANGLWHVSYSSLIPTSPLQHGCNDFSNSLPCAINPNSEIVIKILLKSDLKPESWVHLSSSAFDLQKSLGDNGAVSVCLKYDVEQQCFNDIAINAEL
ncbi:hypothetical protein SAMN05428964_104357 [Thalassospira xiamenensis]|uniref:Uncharacterized protein n=1 Tax=Thalassospira xiamenensis TaxID=220697 RepID=A0A285TPH0_9PROT|nr:hypothetical protein SAMN05428964_104357 [Thalassospira xiamenensis]